jgi:hypothetical protein
LEGPQGPEGPPGPAGPSGPAGDAGDSHWQLSGLDTFYTAGNVGVGEASPDARLDVEQVGDTVAIFNRTGNNGIIVELQQDGVMEGNISVAGITVSYNAFTGSHYAWTHQAIDAGALVRMTAVNRRLHDNPQSEIIYGVEPARRANDPACLGAFLGLLESSSQQGPENPHLVAAAGNADMWIVADTRPGDGGAANISPGDLLISSGTPGCAMKDDAERFEVGYIVARAAEAVDWNTVAPEADGTRRAKISVLLGGFVRSGGASAQRGGEGLQRGALARLEERLQLQQMEIQALQLELLALRAAAAKSPSRPGIAITNLSTEPAREAKQQK